MSLSSDPQRALTSREIATILASLLGGLATFCETQDLCDALNHFYENPNLYRNVWTQAFLNTMIAREAKRNESDKE